MVRGGWADQAGAMTDASQQEQTAPPGLDTQNLRNYERLTRSRTDRKIAGVAGGLGRHLNVDPTVLRVLFVVLVLFGGAGLLLYVAAWLLVPEEGKEHGVIRAGAATRNALLVVVGVIAGLILLSTGLGAENGFPWPLAVLALVVLVLVLNRDRNPAPPPPSAGPVPGPTPGPAQPASTETAQPASTGSYDDTRAGEPTISYPASPGFQAGAAPGAAPPWSYPPSSVAVEPKPDRGPLLFGPTVALLLLALGLLASYDVAGGDVTAAAYAALAVAVVGAMLVVGSVAGRAGGLILLGLVGALALGVTSAVDDGWSTQTRLTPAPVAATDVRDRYQITAGQVRLDLTGVTDPENLDGRTVALRATAGELLVLVPDGVDVVVDAEIRFGGEIEVDGLVQSGNDVALRTVVDGGEQVPTLELDLDLTMGHIEVRQEDAA